MSSWIETEIGTIPANWKIGSLGEICELLTDGAHLSPKPQKSDFYMASVKDMRYNYFDFKECKTISEEDFQKLLLNNCSPKYGDILLSKDGANCLDLIFVYKQPETIVLLSSIAIARLKDGYDPDFYRYILLSPNIQYLMRNNYVSGSAIPRVILKDFKNVPVPILGLTEQKAIAEILSSLDDKIDLLHRQNQTLESLAQTLFRQWFIEEAKEEWEEKPLSKIADFLNGLACQKFPPQNDIEKLPVLKIKDLKDGISENSDYATSDVKPEYIVNNGDVIFAWSASLMVKIWDGEQCVLNQHLFKVTSKDFPKWFYYHWCKYHLDNFIAISSAHATTMGHIKRGDLDEAMCVIPSNEELVKMDDEISPIFEKIETNSRQIKSLEKMRDTLLPKLLSGEVRVKI
ncbi:MAG: restriction endonuclease subunit S [Arcobacter sp.]|uniref:restriction endonuclease subunit S n=1 Tax=Arcobacter sp. TaxID=1872629 RepID=UPI00258EAF4E|nr:restriction endonuclease subunit S [Arcobacter sp.]MDD3008445.1 restriction endonuclease subunit S [Arcobacter sp.]